MEKVDDAEKEASEVLHSLLSIERIEKQVFPTDEDQVCLVSSKLVSCCILLNHFLKHGESAFLHTNLCMQLEIFIWDKDVNDLQYFTVK